MGSLLSGWLDLEGAIIMGSALAAFLAVVLVWQTLLVRDPMASRAKLLAAREAALRAGVLDASEPRTERSRLKRRGMEIMRRVLGRLKLLHGETARRFQLKLARAGLRSRDAMVVFLFCKVSLPMAFGLLGVTFLNGLDVYGLPSGANLLLSCVAVLVGAYAPDIYIKNIADKRKQAIRKSLPDALDLLVICAEAGLTLDAALDRVAREIAPAAPELADEATLTSIELRFLPERRKALENLADRCDQMGVQALVSALLQTEKYGTPLAQSLRVLSDELRKERMMRAEEKAARLPAIMTVPMILFILPALFVVLIGPGALQVLDSLINVRW